MPDIVPNFCTLPSELAVLFYWILSRRPFLRPFVNYRFRSGALHRMWFGTCGCSYHRVLSSTPMPYLYSETNESLWTIVRLSKAMSAALVSNKFLRTPSKILFHNNNNLFTQPPQGDQAGSAHTTKGAGPPHPSRGGAWPKDATNIILNSPLLQRTPFCPLLHRN